MANRTQGLRPDRARRSKAEVSQGWNESPAWEAVRIITVDPKNWPTSTETTFWEVRLKPGPEAKEVVRNCTPGVQSGKVRCWNGLEGKAGRPALGQQQHANSPLLARHQVNPTLGGPPLGVSCKRGQAPQVRPPVSRPSSTATSPRGWSVPFCFW